MNIESLRVGDTFTHEPSRINGVVTGISAPDKNKGHDVWKVEMRGHRLLITWIGFEMWGRVERDGQLLYEGTHDPDKCREGIIERRSA
jgi:hypothetical protein